MTKNQRDSMRRKAVITEARKLGLSLDTPRGRSTQKATVKESATIALMTGDARNRPISAKQTWRINEAHKALKAAKLSYDRKNLDNLDNMGAASDYWRQNLAPVLAENGITIK